MQRQLLNIPSPLSDEINETICCFVIFKMKRVKLFCYGGLMVDRCRGKRQIGKKLMNKLLSGS